MGASVMLKKEREREKDEAELDISFQKFPAFFFPFLVADC